MSNPKLMLYFTPAYRDPVGLTATSPKTIVSILSAIPMIPNIKLSSITFSPLILLRIKLAVPPCDDGFNMGSTDAV